MHCRILNIIYNSQIFAIMNELTFTSDRELGSQFVVRYVLINETLSLDEYTESCAYSALPFVSLPCMTDVYTSLADFLRVPYTDLFILSISRL